jgi:arylsulfatase A-like enzyme
MKVLKRLAIVMMIVLAASCEGQQTGSSQEDFNIVLITIDTLRADHLSCYGYERNTSPNIDKIAEKGIVFHNAVAPSSWTAPSMVSLFTSVYPVNHGVVHGIGGKWNPRKQEVFSEELITLTEILKSKGYTTFGVASNLHLSRKLGFGRGFDYFECLSFLPASPVNEVVFEWEKAIKKSNKFFLWVHYFDPHSPYIPRTPWVDHYTSRSLTQKLNFPKKTFSQIKQLIPRFRADPQMLENLVALYDSEIHYVDYYLGKLIRKLDLDQNSLMIISSDHGEEFLDHGQLGHGNNLYRETINVPLIVKLPDSLEKKTVGEYVNLIDIMPTILESVDATLPEQILGKSFWNNEKTLLAGGTSDYNFSELDTEKLIKTIITPQWKYVYNYENKKEQLFNISVDPMEQNDLSDKEREQCNRLKEKLSNWVAQSKKYPPVENPVGLSPDEKEKLKNLGYIN